MAKRFFESGYVKESIDLIDEIWKIHPYSRVLFTTFKYNQYFFEKHVFTHFRGKSLPLLLVDYNEYQNSLRESGASKLAGIRYLIDSVLISNGTFHPKVIVACSDKEIKLIVSSANLTHAGFSKNAEICSVETVPFDERNDSAIIYQACDFLTQLQKHIESKPHRQNIETLVDKIDLDSQQTTVETKDTFLFHNLKESILEQTRKIIADDVTRIIVVSPFFSQDLPLYEKVADEFTDNIEFIIQPKNNNLPVDVLENWKLTPKLRFSSITFKDNRSLHGKMILFQTKSEVYALTGSANFTNKALMLSTGNGGNVEVVLVRRDALKYFDYLFDSNMLRLDRIHLKEVDPVTQAPSVAASSDFRILEANIVGDKLAISFDHNSAGALLKIKIHVDKLERDFLVETTSNLITLPLSSDDLQALTTSSVVSLTLEYSGQTLSSDLRLIHNPLYLPEQFSVLNTIIDEDERTWLFKVLNRYANLPSFNYVLPIIERMEEYGLFDLKPIDREELLLRLQARIANIKPYSATDQIIQLIDRFRLRHERRMHAAMESKDLNQLQTVINSFVMINKLIIWLVRRGLQDVNYLIFVKVNVEGLFDGKYIMLNDPNEIKTIRENRLLAYVIMLSHTVDHYQMQSPKFREANPNTGRNHVKDEFERTFISAIQFLREVSEDDMGNDLKSLATEFADFAPEVDFATSSLMSRLNSMIDNVNRNPYGRYSFPPFKTV